MFELRETDQMNMGAGEHGLALKPEHSGVSVPGDRVRADVQRGPPDLESGQVVVECEVQQVRVDRRHLHIHRREVRELDRQRAERPQGHGQISQ